MTAIYPDNAVFNPNTFSVLGQVTYTNTGISNVAFSLPSGVDHRGQILAFKDGIIASTDEYVVSGAGSNVCLFLTPPDSSNLTLKTISIPARFSIQRTLGLQSTRVEYANTYVTTVNSNTFTVDGARTTFSLPHATNASSKAELFVSISGVQQESNTFVFPSTTLGGAGVDFTQAVASIDSIIVNVIKQSPTVYMDRRTTMVDKKPDRGYTESEQFNEVQKFTSQSGHEKRRLSSRRYIRKYDLSYSNISGFEKRAIETFFRERNGEYEAFYFELSHINQTGTVTVRFDGPLQKSTVYSGTTDLDSFFNVSFSLIEVFS